MTVRMGTRHVGKIIRDKLPDKFIRDNSTSSSMGKTGITHLLINYVIRDVLD